jgi:hypothetical protein
MVSRRTLVSSFGAGAIGTIAGWRILRPAVRVRTGVSHLHPASEPAIENRLRPDTAHRGIGLVPPDATALVGPTTPESIATALERAETDATDRVHVVVQLESTPDDPRRLHIEDVGWRFPRTLVATTSTDEWGSLSDIDDEEERERLANADRLVTTGIWSLSVQPKWNPSAAVFGEQ